MHKNRNLLKKAFVLFIALSMVLSALACGEQPTSAPEPSDSQEASTAGTTAEESTVPESTEQKEAEEPLPPFEETIDLDADLETPELCLVTIGELSDEVLEQAFQEVALAYYYKNPFMQYDIGKLSTEERTTSARRTTNQSPEETDWDAPHYAQCTEYGQALTYEAYGIEFIGDRLHQYFPDDLYGQTYQSAIVVKFDATRGDTNREEVIEQIKKLARSGDVLFGIGTGTGSLGHCIQFVGDINGDGTMWCTHTWPVGGGSLTTAGGEELSGAQRWEPNGATQLQTAERLLYMTPEEANNSLVTGEAAEPNWGLSTEKNELKIYLYRPTQLDSAQDQYLPAATASRIKYSRMSISKTLVEYAPGEEPGDSLLSKNVSVHTNAFPGESLTVCLTVQNNSSEVYEGLRIAELVPGYAELVTAQNALIFETQQDAIMVKDNQTVYKPTVDGRKLMWTVDVPAGGQAVIFYTFRCTATAGSELTVPAGRVDHIPTREITLQVGTQALTNDQLAILEQIATTKKAPQEIATVGKQDLNFVNLFYQKLSGIVPELPSTTNEFLNHLFKAKASRFGSDTMLMLLDEGSRDEKLYKMIVKNQIGGSLYSVGGYTGLDYENTRIVDVKEGYFSPGDVIVSFGGESRTSVLNDKELFIDIYLGAGQVLRYSAGAMGVMAYDKTLETILGQNFVVVLRPTLAK